MQGNMQMMHGMWGSGGMGGMGCCMGGRGMMGHGMMMGERETLHSSRSKWRWAISLKSEDWVRAAKTLYNRWKRWSDNGVFARIMVGLAAESAEHKTIMIDATYLKAHRTASSLCVKKGGANVRSGGPKVA